MEYIWSILESLFGVDTEYIWSIVEYIWSMIGIMWSIGVHLEPSLEHSGVDWSIGVFWSSLDLLEFNGAFRSLMEPWSTRSM